MKTLLATTAIALTLAVPAVAAEMKYPNWYAFEMTALQMNGVNGVRGTPYLECDYAARTCLKGYAARGNGNVYIFVGALVDGDNRQVELRHLKCLDNFRNCNDYDRGISWKGGLVEKPDMAFACVELMRTTGRFDSSKEPCLGYGFEDFNSQAQIAQDDAKAAKADIESWRMHVTAHIMKYKIRMDAKTTIKITIDRNGNIKSNDVLAQWQLNRLPPPPAAVKGETVTLVAVFDQQTTQPFITVQKD